MNPILLARHVEESLREQVRATLNTSTHAFDGMVDRFLEKPENFIKGPWVSVDMPFQQIDVAEDGSWTQPFPDIPLRFAPYRHQMEAFARLGGDTPRSTLIATGTGSGKTESYLWPILEHCRKNMGKPGIKAILIYPMNALATDQARRIASALTSTPALKGIRAGIYADEEPKSPTYEVTADSIITHRDTMRQTPPDILLTNYKMLDYLLLRGRDKKLWAQNDPATLRFLVVDEMHTFDGAQGADLALLIRRLKYRLATPEHHLICVGSSATLGSGEKAAKGLREYARTIFGETFDEASVVRESRKTPSEVFAYPEYLDQPEPTAVRTALNEAENLDQPGAAARLTACLFPDLNDEDPDLAALDAHDPEDPIWRITLGKLLLQHLLCQRTLQIIAEHVSPDAHPCPASLDDIATGLGQVKVLREWSAEDLKALAELIVALVAWARTGTPKAPRPLFNVRLQLWIREMARMVTNLPRQEVNDKLSEITLSHALDHDLDDLRSQLPIVHCSRCGATAHIGKQDAANKSYWAPLDQLYSDFFDNNGGGRLRLFYHDAIDRSKNVGGGHQVVKGLLNAETVEFTPSDLNDLEPGPAAPAWMYDPTDDRGHIDRTCPVCGQKHGLLLFGMRAARLTTGVTEALYTSEQNEESATAKPRFLMFSDSVQDAAHRAAVAEIRNSLSVYQKSLYKALESSETKGMTLEDVYERLPDHYLDQMGADNFTAEFIVKEQTWRQRYKDLIDHNTSIDDPVFLEQMKTRLGWEYFVDLSYRAHFSHTLEANGIAVADIPSALLRPSAEKLSHKLQIEFPKQQPVSPDVLTRFLMGLVQRMRQQGSIAHPYIANAVELINGKSHMNWFGAAARLRLNKPQTLPVPNPRKGAAPTPITLQGGISDFDLITRKASTNWYRDWFFRTFDAVDLSYGNALDDIYRMALERLEADALVRRVNCSDGRNHHAWLLEPSKITVSTNVLQLACDHCGRQETSLAENAEVIKAAHCPRIGCDGHMAQTSEPPRPALHRALDSDRNHRVVAREHTGILEADERLLVETGFIKGESTWSPNMISATPTLEMGIDIGDLSTLLLSSVPPEEANYVQRIGRSGRRDGNSLNMVLANAKPHDLQFWEDPTPMLSGQVQPPGVFLAAEEVLLRQVTAFTLDRYVTTTAEESDYGTVQDVLRHRKADKNVGFPAEWLAMAHDRGTELADTFLSGLPDEVKERTDLVKRIRSYLTGNDDKSIGWRIGEAFDKAAEERERLLKKRADTTRELERLRKAQRKAELKPEEFEKQEKDILRDRKAINSLIKYGIDKISVIKFLTDNGCLPNYAFPEEGVKLTSILSQKGDSSTGKDDPLYLEYSRPASSALSEFAPGQYFYANSRQIQIQRIELGKDDLKKWIFCPTCSFAMERAKAGEIKVCPKCGTEMWSDPGSTHEVVQLKSVIAVNKEEKAAIRDGDQRDQRRFDRELVPFYEPRDIIGSWSNRDTETPFGFEFISNCTFRDFNFGPKSNFPGNSQIAGDKRQSQPFRICRYCGTLQRYTSDEGSLGDHTADCRVTKEHNVPPEDWQTDVYLMREFTTEAIRLVIPVVGEADDDTIKSFIAAINLGLQKYFAGKIDHIRSTVTVEKMDNHLPVRSLYLYDSVPGGSGYLRQIGTHPETMNAVITCAVEALRNCPCNKDPDSHGCYRCVKSYRSQFGPGEPDRDLARHLMETILQKWEGLSKESTGIDSSMRNTLLESTLEKRFLGVLSKHYGEKSLTPQVLDGKRGYLLRSDSNNSKTLWNIEPQVQIDARYPGLPKKRVDFLLTPVSKPDTKPIIIEMDGLEYHADSVIKDLDDRINMIRSNKLRVWTLTWKDLEAKKEPHNIFNDATLGNEAIGRICRATSHNTFKKYKNTINKIRTNSSLEELFYVLDCNENIKLHSYSILLRTILGHGKKLEELPRISEISIESKSFLKRSDLSEFVGNSDLSLYISSNKISPKLWESEFSDIRTVLHVNLPNSYKATTPDRAYEDVWRGLWRLVNFLQVIPGFHVDMEGLDTLLPPDSEPVGENKKASQITEEWVEARDLSDTSFIPLIDALIAAEVPPPDCIGDDLLFKGRVIGMIELGWDKYHVGISEEPLDSTDWTIIHFPPKNGSISETVSKIIDALSGATHD